MGTAGRPSGTKGHKIRIEWTKEAKNSTGVCLCGWSKTSAKRADVLTSYHRHLEHVQLQTRRKLEKELKKVQPQ
jgi:hypothetical protein